MAELLLGVAVHAPFSPIFHTYPKFGIAYEFTTNPGCFQGNQGQYKYFNRIGRQKEAAQGSNALGLHFCTGLIAYTFVPYSGFKRR
ncbi:hypothetical protein [Desulfitobacterium chlororespirans]|uniref:hypothetical protein n=1 Tax=Desulfitobacterium chlororespirans TaxID=51616 RepID=UPI0011608A2C|nr:hypothetical protein [Desulfitobacterium chlororespirans]